MINRIGFSNQPISKPQPVFKGGVNIKTVDDVVITPIRANVDLICLAIRAKNLSKEEVFKGLKAVHEKLNAVIEYLSGKGKKEIKLDDKDLAEFTKSNARHSKFISDFSKK